MANKISDVVRKAIVDKLILIGQVPGGCTYKAFFQRVYPKAAKLPCNRTNLLNEIERHCDINPHDWGNEATKFDNVGYLEWTDQEFLYFCSEYVSPVFNRFKWNEDRTEKRNLQSDCVDAINSYLKSCGYELRGLKRIGDKIEYELAELMGVKGKVNNIVFAAIQKPDVLLTDVLNQRVKIPVDESKYLLYEEEIGTDGLTWKKLREWYDSNHLSFNTNLLEILSTATKHCESTIEEDFFKIYLDVLEEYGDDIPALLPQVYLYYDSKVQYERTIKIFDHQCMDFLMLFSESQRVVIELDGIRHYSDGKILCQGERYPRYFASPSVYAETVSAQRDMTHAGYEVYRFGGKEFYNKEQAKDMVKRFFKDLFAKHGIISDK